MKECSKCSKIKSFDSFSKNKSKDDGLQRICKECKSLIYQKEKETRLLYQKHYNNLNKENKQKWNRRNWVNNKNTIKEYNKIWRNNNKDKINLYQKNWRKEKYNNDLNYKITENLRSRFWSILNSQNVNKNNSILDLLGCSIVKLKQYLENQFPPEMSWDNHGEIWEIDHIKPCANFILENLEEQKICFHYTNLQPLFKTTQIAESYGYSDQIGNRNKGKN